MGENCVPERKQTHLSVFAATIKELRCQSGHHFPLVTDFKQKQH